MSFLCPPDVAETARAYCIGRLSCYEAGRFEEHFLVCRECLQEAKHAAIFVAAMPSAGSKNGKSAGAPAIRNMERRQR